MLRRKIAFVVAGNLFLAAMVLAGCVPIKRRTPRPGNIRNSASRNGDEQKSEKVETVTPFQIEECSCPDLDLPLDENNSYASDYLESWASFEGTSFSSVQQLNCIWEEGYQSQNKTGLIFADMDIYHFYREDEAQQLLDELTQDRALIFKECTPENLCSGKIIEKSGERVFYLLKNVYPVDGNELPSTHIALLTRSIETNKIGAFVIDIYLEHPEQEMGSSWTGDAAKTLEACALELVQKK